MDNKTITELLNIVQKQKKSIKNKGKKKVWRDPLEESSVTWEVGLGYLIKDSNQDSPKNTLYDWYLLFYMI